MSKDPAPRPEFTPSALERSGVLAKKFEDDLSIFAVTCAIEDASPKDVTSKHVDQAFEAILKAESVRRNQTLAGNPRIWWGLAGICFALALATPDAGQMWVGEPDATNAEWWHGLKTTFVVASVAGAICWTLGLLIAVGVLDQGWFRNLRRAIFSRFK